MYQAQQEKQLFPVDTGSVYNTKCNLTRLLWLHVLFIFIFGGLFKCVWV